MLAPDTCVISSAVGPSQRVDQLIHLAPLLATVTACDCMLDTVADMVLEDFLLNPPQRGAHRGDLRDDVDAIAVTLDHASDPAHLALDAAEAAKA
jgi:hypothetical protein